MLETIWRSFGRDLALVWRRPEDFFMTWVFFAIVVSLFPLGVGADPVLLQRMAAGLLWVAALLATLLSLPRVLEEDWRDGSLEQMALSPEPLALQLCGKLFAHALSNGLSLALLAPLLALQFNLDSQAILYLCLSLILGTPALSAIGLLGAAVTLGLRSGAVLLSLLIMPLYVPVLIFGAGAVEAVQSGVDAQAHLSLLTAYTLAALGLVPWTAAKAVRIALD
jgi:heme exporter protein B